MTDKDYFGEALHTFTTDFAYGGAIKHLVRHGYDTDKIIREYQYPLSRETIENMVEKYRAEIAAETQEKKE